MIKKTKKTGKIYDVTDVSPALALGKRRKL
jgi:hypothetical protein